jgi:hypothetical protein
MFNSEPIRLTYGEFFRELDDLFCKGLSSQMVLCLQRLVASHGRSVKSPKATEYLKSLFESRLQAGILLSDDRRTVHYNIKVKNSSFRLVPKRKTKK